VVSNVNSRPRICLVVSDFYTVRVFLLDQIRALSKRYEVTVVANVTDRNLLRNLHLEAELVPLAIVRKIDLWRDALALLQLFLLIRKRKFTLIHSITPKAGLLTMTAAKLAGVPTRIHTFTGQVWVTRSGWMRKVLKWADTITACCATQILTDSPSQLRFLIAERIVKARRIHVRGNGSICGVDPTRFRPDAAARRRVRVEISIPDDASLFLFAGRLTEDKGVLDLARAFQRIAERNQNSYLLFVGPDEGNLEGKIRCLCPSAGEQIRFLGHSQFIEQYMAAADVLCLPSYREGFGNVVIEAAAAGIPAIASRIYGLTDAVVDGITGCLHQPGNCSELARAMASLAANRSLRLQLGRQARARATKDFSMHSITASLLTFYAEQLAALPSSATGLSAPAKRISDPQIAGRRIQ
jgi:glycosyltransferase involved in cell wall biosynthesis